MTADAYYIPLKFSQNIRCSSREEKRIISSFMTSSWYAKRHHMNAKDEPAHTLMQSGIPDPNPPEF
jgi:hypothetical protein